MTTTLEAANETLRNAVRTRLDATPADDPKMAGYKAEAVTKPRQLGASAEEMSQDDHGVDWDKLADGPYIEHLLQRLAGDGLLAAEGTTAKFGTGAVRSDSVEEFRYDLVSPIGLREVARACAEGAEKYGDWNWEKGMPVHDLLNHAIAHIYGFLSGDRSEPHLGHAAWNLLAAIHSHELWPTLNAGTLRGDGCRAPLEEAK
jgi:hypothetical protein